MASTPTSTPATLNLPSTSNVVPAMITPVFGASNSFATAAFGIPNVTPSNSNIIPKRSVMFDLDIDKSDPVQPFSYHGGLLQTFVQKMHPEAYKYIYDEQNNLRKLMMKWKVLFAGVKEGDILRNTYDIDEKYFPIIAELCCVSGFYVERSLTNNIVYYHFGKTTLHAIKENRKEIKTINNNIVQLEKKKEEFSKEKRKLEESVKEKEDDFISRKNRKLFRDLHQNPFDV